MTSAVAAFRTVAIAEALSWTGLLVGMAFKYLVVGDDIGVKIFGPIHGGLFLVYLAMTMLVRRQLRWSTAVTVFALLASVPPLGTLVFERWATRTGRLQVGTRTQRSEALDVHPPTEARTP
jgi:integral membrane protein